jgi:FkbM family methyltransferase
MLRGLKNGLKERLYRRIGVNFNPYGVPFALGKHLGRNSRIVVVDVGAHRGDFTRSIVQFCGVRRGVLIEPQSEHASRLRGEFEGPQFEVVEAAISDRVGTTQLEINAFDATSSILRIRREMRELSGLDVRSIARVSCRTMTLDVVFEQTKLPHVDLLKVDVQGTENLVFRGGENTLANTSMVWTEVSFKRLYEDACLYSEIYDLLTQRGFALFELESGFRGPSGELIQADALFIRR